MDRAHLCRLALTAAAATFVWSTAGHADPYANERGYHRSIFQQVLPEPVAPRQPMPYASATDDGVSRRQPNSAARVVAYDSREAPGTIIIDTSNTYLYYVLGQGRAIRYGIGVGRDGFTWAGVQSIARKQEWPDWHPPAEMIARQPYLPRFMSGGPGNPLGARAMYLGNTMYRIHGTNAPETIGQRVSSGCIRLTNDGRRRPVQPRLDRRQGRGAAGFADALGRSAVGAAPDLRARAGVACRAADARDAAAGRERARAAA